MILLMISFVYLIICGINHNNNILSFGTDIVELKGSLLDKFYCFQSLFRGETLDEKATSLARDVHGKYS